MQFACALARSRPVIATVAISSTALLASAAYVASGFFTQVQPFAVSLVPNYDVLPLLSVADRVPRTGHPGEEYQLIGIPDGLGAHRNFDGTVTVFVSHELTNTRLSEPRVGGPLNRGAFVSKLILDCDGGVISGDRAYDTVYLADTLVGPAADDTNSTPGFGRFCSGSLAGWAEGFDRPIYFANEESGAPAVFDGQGGLAVAIFDNEAHGLPDLGRFPWENALVQRNFGSRTVVMGMEDGPASQNPADVNSQLYMYVGTKDHSPGATVLERNGLVGGTLYVFRALEAAKNSELGFQNGTLLGEWIAIPNAGSMSESQLEAASDAVGAMVFARPEDGAFNPRNKHNYFFVTTGGAAGANVLGRLYSMNLNPWNPTGLARLSIAYNADQVVAAGGDIALSPDNIEASWNHLTICEDGTTESRAVMTSKNRDGSIWRFNLTGLSGVSKASARRIVELDPPGRDGVTVGAGVWETSGIVDTTWLFGFDTWLFDVQAHGPTAAPAPNTVEDGQLLLLKRASH
jgi:hypothetical protein